MVAFTEEVDNKNMLFMSIPSSENIGGGGTKVAKRRKGKTMKQRRRLKPLFPTSYLYSISSL